MCTEDSIFRLIWKYDTPCMDCDTQVTVKACGPLVALHNVLLFILVIVGLFYAPTFCTMLSFYACNCWDEILVVWFHVYICHISVVFICVNSIYNLLVNILSFIR